MYVHVVHVHVESRDARDPCPVETRYSFTRRVPTSNPPVIFLQGTDENVPEREGTPHACCRQRRLLAPVVKNGGPREVLSTTKSGGKS